MKRFKNDRVFEGGSLVADRRAPTGTPGARPREVTKSFGGTLALHDAQIELYPGEVHALLGENGAGKSTLIKIITGLHQPDRGEISSMASRSGVVAGRRPAPRRRRDLPGAVIFPDLSVAENIFIGHRDRGRDRQLATHERDAAEICALDVVSIRAPGARR